MAEEIITDKSLNILPIELYLGNQLVIRPAGTTAKIIITAGLGEAPTCEVISERICEHFLFDRDMTVVTVVENTTHEPGEARTE